MKKRMIYAIISTISVIIGAFFFQNPFGGSDNTPQKSGVIDDSAFANMIHGQAASYMTFTNDELVTDAKKVCAQLDAGRSAQEVHDDMISAVDASAVKDTEYFMSASVTTYCVKYSGAVAPYINK